MQLRYMIINLMLSAVLLVAVTAVASADASVVMTQAKAAIDVRDYEEAICLYHSVVTNYPADPLAPEAVLQLGRCYRLLHDNNSAIATFEYLADKYPSASQAPDAAKQCASCYLENKDVLGAADHFKAVAEQYPGSDAALESLFHAGNLYKRQGVDTPAERVSYFKRADDMFAVVLKMFPDNEAKCKQARIEREWIANELARMGSKSWSEVDNQITELQQMHPDAAVRSIVLSARAAFGRKDYQTAVTLAERVISASDKTGLDEKDANMIAAQSYARLGDYDSAINHFMAMLEAYDRQDLTTREERIAASLHGSVAECYFKWKKVSEACAEWSFIVDNYPNTPEAKAAKAELRKHIK